MGWALNGEYGGWVKDNQVAIQINDTIFLHGGISAKYCKFSLQSLTEQVIAAMENYNPAVISINSMVPEKAVCICRLKPLMGMETGYGVAQTVKQRLPPDHIIKFAYNATFSI